MKHIKYQKPARMSEGNTKMITIKDEFKLKEPQIALLVFYL